LLAGKLTGLNPDMVIAYDGVNDAHYSALVPDGLWRPNFTDTAEGYRRRFTSDINLQQSVRDRLVSLLQGASYTMFYASELAGGRSIRNIRSTDDLSPDEYSRWYASLREKACSASVAGAAPYPGLADMARARVEGAIGYARNIATMQAASEAAGAIFVHVLQPTALNKKHLFPCESFSLRWNEAAYHDFKHEMSKQYALLGQETTVLAKRQHGGIYLDLSHATDDIDEYLYDDWHHAFPTGHLTEIVGDLIVKGIKDAGRAER
jgi:hypothetical protein